MAAGGWGVGVGFSTVLTKPLSVSGTGKLRLVLYDFPSILASQLAIMLRLAYIPASLPEVELLSSLFFP